MTLESIQSLINQVKQLSQECQMANPDGVALQQHFLMIQQCFQTQVLPLADAVAIPETVQPILTEMNRTLRLLGTDVVFIQTARQNVTVQRRQRQMTDKLQKLMTFCEALEKALVV